MTVPSTAGTLLWLAFFLAAGLGSIAHRTHFCTMGAVADIVNMGDWNRMRMWLLAIGVAILGAAFLHAGGLIDLGKSIYRTPNFLWLSYLLGGFCFGIGMVLASGCGGKALIRVGGGNLKSLVVCLVLGLVAYMTLRGVLAVFRVNVLEKAAIFMADGQDLPALLAGFGLAPRLAFWLPVLGLGGGLSAYALVHRDFWRLDRLLGGCGVGLAVVAAWYLSGHLGYLPEHPETLEEAFIATNSGRMEALSFVAPQAYGLELLMLWSDSSRTLSLGIVSAMGMVAGAFVSAISSGTFRWEGFSGLEDTVNHLLGAALMGFGGVVAMGCTIGQGISGFSTLALGSILSMLAIVLGAAVMLKFQYWRLLRAA